MFAQPFASIEFFLWFLPSPLPPTFCLLAQPSNDLSVSQIPSHCIFLCLPASPSEVCLPASLCLHSPLSPPPWTSLVTLRMEMLKEKGSQCPGVSLGPAISSQHRALWITHWDLTVDTHDVRPWGQMKWVRQMKWVKILHIVRHTVTVISNPSAALQGNGETYNLSPIFCLLNLLVQP